MPPLLFPSPSSPLPTQTPKCYISHPKSHLLLTCTTDPKTALYLSNSSHPSNPTSTAPTPPLSPPPPPGKLQTILSILSYQIFLQHVQFHESLLLSLILFFAKFNSPKKILILFSFVPCITSRKPFQKDLTMALDLFVGVGRFNLVNVLFGYCRDNLKMNSNICVYNIPIKCCCHAGKVDEGFKVPGLMSLRPNLITYSTLMGGLCKEVRMKDAFKASEEMMDRVE